MLEEAKKNVNSISSSDLKFIAALGRPPALI
jgi:hypothetical protein